MPERPATGWRSARRPRASPAAFSKRISRPTGLRRRRALHRLLRAGDPRQPHAARRFQTPVYGLPADLIRVDLGSSRRSSKANIFPAARRPAAGALRHPRRDRRQGRVRRQDPVLVRRSGGACSSCRSRARAGCGSRTAPSARIAYAGENGRPYTAIGRVLIADGTLARDRYLAGDHPRLAEGQSRTGAGRDGSRPVLHLFSRKRRWAIPPWAAPARRACR